MWRCCLREPFRSATIIISTADEKRWQTAEAREWLREAKRRIEQGISPAIEKQRQQQQAKSSYFGD